MSTQINDSIPELVDISYYSNAVRPGLLPYRIANVFVSSAIFWCVVMALFLAAAFLFPPASAQAPGSLLADPGAGFLDTTVAPMVFGGICFSVPFFLFQNRFVRVATFLICSVPVAIWSFVGFAKFFPLLVLGIRGEEVSTDVEATLVVQGLSWLLSAGIFSSIPLGLAKTLSSDRTDFATALALAKPKLQVASFPVWLNFSRYGKIFALPFLFVLNGLMCTAFGVLYFQIFATPWYIELATATNLRNADVNGPFYVSGSKMGELIGWFLLAFLAGVSLRFGRWASAKFFPMHYASDLRDPVLFLRSFQDDQAFLGKLKLSYLGRFLTLESYPPNLDAMLVQELSNTGPVLAFQGHFNMVTKVGSVRVPLPSEDWQPFVLSEMHRAQRILVVVERTPGTVWEIEQIIRDEALLAKTVFLKSPKSRVEETLLPEDALLQLGDCRSLRDLFKLDRVFAVEMSAEGIRRVFAAKYPDALDYQCLIRSIFGQ